MSAIGLNYLQGRGKVSTATLDANPNDNTIGNPLIWVGNASAFDIEPSSDRTKITDYYTGLDGVDSSWLGTVGGKVKITAEQSSGNNFVLSLLGKLTTTKPEDVVGAKIAYFNKVTNKWEEITDNSITLVASKDYYFVKSIADDAASVEYYDNIDPDTFVLHDSTATPVTLTVTTHYSFDGSIGKLRLTAAGVAAITTLPLKANFTVGQVTDVLPTPLAYGYNYQLSYQNISDVIVKDSKTGTPNIIPANLYEIDPVYGTIKFTNKTTLTAISGFKLPLKVTYRYGETTQVAILAKDTIERRVVLHGINRRTQKKIMLDLYRVSFDPTNISFLDEKYTKTPLEGELMIDPSKPADGALGQYGRLVYLD